MLVESVPNLAFLRAARRVERRDPRYFESIPLKLQRYLRFGPSTTRGVSLDISSHGMSALVCGPPRKGETVVIELQLPGMLVQTLATVRHSTDSRSGFEFYPLSSSSEAAIQNWLAILRKGEETLFTNRYSIAAKKESD
jgi:hypothetical protein